ncbi:MAG: DUF58 domain-containing protein [Gemmatimonadota bacterium]|jgi:uncharacterized protein (DUF58 family)
MTPRRSETRSAQRGPGTGAQFLDPDVLARIDNLELLARTVVDGFLNGLHRSPYLGLSLDFAEHRSYMPGDDIRLIDWKLWARTDRHYVKQFEAETNADFSVLLDVSRSMRYGSGDVTKLDYARYLAACLTYFSRRQRDRVGLVTFDADVAEYIPPSSRHLDRILHTLDRAGRDPGPGAPGTLEGPLLKAGESLRRKGILALVSDLYEEADRVLRVVRTLAARGHDVLVFHVLDPAERDFPFQDASSFEDMETGERMPVVPSEVARGYREVVAAHLRALEEGFVGDRVDYQLLDTSRPLDHALHRYLVVREKKSRVR